MPATRRQNRTVLVVTALVTLLGLAIWWRPQEHQTSPAHNEAFPAPPAPALRRSERNPPRDTTLGHDLLTAAEALKTVDGPEGARKQFANLRSQLAASPPEVASTAIREFLDSRIDAPSQLDLAIAPNGFLKESSSLRVFLLDYLAQVDLPTAGAYAEKILGSKDSADEWAVSLRNYALANPTPEARAFLRQKLDEMIQHEPWQKNPSTGFLEAFDVAVYAGGTELLPTLTELLRQKENKAVAHAAYLALDRLTLTDAAAVLGELQRQRDWMAGREATRANYFSRADVQDARQKMVLEQYLLNPQMSGAELETFAGIYPSGNFMISHNLLTKTVTPDRQSQANQDRAALQAVEGWLADPRFEKIKPQMATIKSRLEKFVTPSQ